MTTIEDRRIAANHDAPAGMAWATVTDEPIGGIPITLALQEDWVAFIVSARGNAYYNGRHPSAGAAMTDLNRRLT